MEAIMKFRKISVLLNEDTGERFNVGDLVRIEMIHPYAQACVGRIDWIDYLDLNLDQSTQYRACSTKIKLDEIRKIEILLF